MEQMVHEINFGHAFEKAITEIQDDSDWDIGHFVDFKFLPCDPADTFVKKLQKYQGIFDLVYLSSALSHRLENCSSIVKNGGRVVVEGAKYLLELSGEQVGLYEDKIKEMGQKAGLKQHNNSNQKYQDYFYLDKPE